MSRSMQPVTHPAFLSALPTTRTSSLIPLLQKSLARDQTSRQTSQYSCFAAGRRRLRMIGTPVDVDAVTFEKEVLSSETPVLVDFYAAWCGPCQVAAPLMDWLATEYDGELKVVKVDMDENESYRNEFKIRGLPTFGIFKNGEKMAMHEGALGKKELRRYVVNHLPDLDRPES